MISIITASEIKNLELAKKFQALFESIGETVNVINLIDLNLPLYTTRSEELHKGEELLKDHLKTFTDTQAFVFIAPEYNGSTPPVFNNFLAWLSRTSKEWRTFLNGKPAVIATFSGGGGHHVLAAMRSQLAFIGMNVLGRQILTHSNKPLDEKSLEATGRELVKYCRIK